MAKRNAEGQSAKKSKSRKADGPRNRVVFEVPAAASDGDADGEGEPGPPGPLGLPYELLDDNELLTVSAELGLAHVQLEGEEAWVLRLPQGMELSMLHGRTLHLPCEPPDARHLRPPPNPFEDPSVDLLAHVRAHIPPTTIGHVALARRPAAAAELGVFRELTQEDEFVAGCMWVVGPAAGTSATTSLELRQAARFIAVGDDLMVADQARLAAAMEQGVPLWGAADGWDGQQAGRKRRKRVAGWKVVDRGVAAPAPGAASDEEFEEEVFGARLKAKPQDQQDQQQQQQQQQQSEGEEEGEEELEGADADDEAEPDPASVVDPQQRHYSEAEQAGDAAEQEQQLLRELLAGLDCGPDGVDIQQFLLSLPIKPEVAEQQELVARIRRKRASKARQEATAQQAAARGQRRQQQQQQRRRRRKGNATPQPQQDTQPYGGHEAAAGSPASVQVISSDGSEPEPSSSELDEGVNWDSLLPPYEPPAPIPLMLMLPPGIQESLEAVAAVQPELAVRLRNACQRRLVNWVDIAQQVQTAGMSDADTERLLSLLPLDDGDDDGNTARRQQVSRLLLPRAGPRPRPHFSTADKGYAVYQPGDEPPVVLGPAGEPEPGGPEDDAVADWLMEAGAGRRARLVDTTELRSKGFAWDSDPEQEQREGLQVVTASGRVVHIPSGVSIDISQALRC